MKQIQNIIEKLIDELNTHENIDQSVYDLIQEIEIELLQPIKIYRSPSRFIYDVQPNFSWTTVDQKMGDPRETDTQKKNNHEKKVMNLAKLTE